MLHVSEKERPPEVQAFAQQYGLESPVLMDSDGAIGNRYGLRGTPTTFYINADGVIEDMKVGFIDMNWIRDRVAGAN